MAYSASYTAGGILFNEFESILTFILEENIKEFLTKEVKENKHLKITTESARKRITQEINKRIDSVNLDFWKYYVTQTDDEKKLLLFYLCIKTYQLVWDFHFKVTIPSYWAYHHRLDDYAFKMYLDELGSKNEEVQGWSESTRKKCITNYMRMLNESGLMINKKIQKPGSGYDFYCYFIHANELLALDIFFLNNQEKETIINYCK